MNCDVFHISGTVYVEKRGSGQCTVDGESSLVTEINTDLDMLTIRAGATVSVSSSVTIGQLMSEDGDSTAMCFLDIPAGVTLTANSVGMYRRILR